MVERNFLLGWSWCQIAQRAKRPRPRIGISNTSEPLFSEVSAKGTALRTAPPAPGSAEQGVLPFRAGLMSCGEGR
eukprot:2568020-Alexandrium_andersonii.AAC.1